MAARARLLRSVFNKNAVLYTMHSDADAYLNRNNIFKSCKTLTSKYNTNAVVTFSTACTLN